MSKFELPSAPAGQAGPVKAWSEPVVIPTYNPLPPDRNPMFLEKRVYQGSSGSVYPLPFTDRISSERVDRAWEALHIENEFLRVMVLPEIGGRIHVGLDKTNGYDFFYRQNVIKPALVGLAGPWASGGVEFNWPQHHRPATYMPVNTYIEAHEDGSQTIWSSDHDPMYRLKGMHGVCLHPGKAYLELKVRLYNRTPYRQTFLWWANVATRVHERYQSFFPPDVHYVADHARRAISSYPICGGSYYGVDYAARAAKGVPAEEMPRHFVPPGGYSPADLSWYANIPVPTSYMALGSSEDFLGGYDHAAEAGLVHVANHHIAPGKKQWTWGNHDFGYGWDRHLTDDDGPYIELMAGVYTDNQPDFSFLAAGETKSFSQYWYPIRKIGPAQKANVDSAVSLQFRDGRARVGVCVSGRFPKASVEIQAGGEKLARWERDLAPEAPLVEEFAAENTVLTVSVRAADGRELIRYTPQAVERHAAPQPAVAPALPAEMPSNDELYLTGLHLEQYRHVTRRPEDYWREALRRDPGDSRCNNAMGLWHLRRGEFTDAERHFRAAIATLTRRNPNPCDGEPFYNLGLALRFLDRDEDAYAAFYKATWNQAWQAAGYHALAELDATRGDWAGAAEQLALALRVNSESLQSRNLRVMVLRKLGCAAEAEAVLRGTLQLDPLDFWARYLAGGPLCCDNQVRLDIALDLARAGQLADAIDVLKRADTAAGDGSVPMVQYTLAHLCGRAGLAAEAAEWYAAAAGSSPDYCFPNRLEDIAILEGARRANPRDARAPYYLGNLLYDRRRHREAIACWEEAARLDPGYSVVWRNLGIGYFNVLGDPKKARQAFEKVRQAAPADARILYERDQLWKRIGEAPARRLAELERHPELVRLRDDLSLELATLYNQTGRHEKARVLLESRQFQPWEGGEGQVLRQYLRACLALGRKSLAAANAAEARRWFEATLALPPGIGEDFHLLADRSDSYYWLGVASAVEGDPAAARQWWRKAAANVRQFSEMTYYRALALQRLGKAEKSERLSRDLLAHAGRMLKTEATVDYFATSLPTMLLFDDDLQKRHRVAARFLQAQANLGLGRKAQARKLLNEVLSLDRNHAGAADLLEDFERSRKAQAEGLCHPWHRPSACALGSSSKEKLVHGSHIDAGSTMAAKYDVRYVLMISTIAALGGLLFGYDWVVIGGAKPFFEKYFHLSSEAQVGWANSCALLGCLLGSIVSGGLSDRFGRKKGLILSAFLFAASSVLTGWAGTFTWFVVWRIAGGVAIGMASGISPMYIAEISPAQWRGRLVALNQLTIVVGILAAQIVNWWIAERVPDGATAEMIRLSWNGQYGWRWMFTAVAVPSVVFFFSVLFVPESPRWLVMKGRQDPARRTLVRIGGEAYAADALREIQGTSTPQGRISWSEILGNAPLRKVLGIGIVLAVLQQWSGINVIFNYAEEIYRNAGYGVNDVLVNIIITGAINLVFTLVAMAMVDGFGRRALMLLGFAGICVSHLLLGLAYWFGLRGLPVLVLTLSTIACYAMSLAPVIWVLISEIFPNRIRGVAVSVAVSALWIACFALTFTFPVLNRALGAAGTFWVYAAICLMGFVFVYRLVPETKNKTLEQIEKEFGL